MGWHCLKCRFFVRLLPLLSTATTLIVWRPGSSPLALIRTAKRLWALLLIRSPSRKTTVYLTPDRLSLTKMCTVKLSEVQCLGCWLRRTCGGLWSRGGP